MYSLSSRSYVGISIAVSTNISQVVISNVLYSSSTAYLEALDMSTV